MRLEKAVHGYPGRWVGVFIAVGYLHIISQQGIITIQVVVVT